MTAIIGGLAAATLWAAATLASSRSSRMLGSTVVLGWVMLFGTLVGLPIAAVTPLPEVAGSTIGLLIIAGTAYVVGLGLTYRALTMGKVGVVAAIVSTEGATGALLAVLLGDRLGPAAAIVLVVIVAGVVLSSIERPSGDVPAGDIDLVVDATTTSGVTSDAAVRRSVVLAVTAAIVFGIGIVSAGHAAKVLPATWVALATRGVGLLVITLPLILRGRLRLTRAALPLLVISGAARSSAAPHRPGRRA